MKLLTEEIQEPVQILQESRNGEKQYFIEGVFIQGDVVNKNRRMYPMDVLREAVEEYKTNYISQKRALGELGHNPDNPGITHDKVSHVILSLKEEGKNFIGKAKVLTEMPCGKLVKILMDEGIKLGVSSKGLGALKESRDGHIVTKYIIRTAADIVSDPSAPDAFVSAIMEGKDWVWDNGKVIEKQLTEVQKELRNKKLRNLETYALNEFNKFLQNL